MLHSSKPMKTAEIICTGSELLIGTSVDTNSVFLSNRLQELGIGVRYKTIVGDERKEIKEVVGHALGRVDLVVLSGGLGPTVDDLTRNVVAELTGKELIFHQEIYDKILARIRRVHSGRIMPEAVKSQAYVPEGADYFLNLNGTAPGLGIEFKAKIIIALPGPPRELKPMWDEDVRDWLKKQYPGEQKVVCRVLRTCGVPESIVDEKINHLFRTSENPKIGVCANPGMVDIRLVGWGDSEKEAINKIVIVEDEIRQILGDVIFGVDNDTLESVVGKLLKKKGWHLSLAESCTGGYIANRITNIPGSSEYFDLSVVTYSNRAKIELLKVPELVLEKHGAVSEETAKAMAQGIQAISKADVAIAVTGIAGPTGGTPEKPVGLVYISLADKEGCVGCKKYNFVGERELIKYRTSQEALDSLRRYLLT